jgi:hypothetical protein
VTERRTPTSVQPDEPREDPVDRLMKLESDGPRDLQNALTCRPDLQLKLGGRCAVRGALLWGWHGRAAAVT